MSYKRYQQILQRLEDSNSKRVLRDLNLNSGNITHRLKTYLNVSSNDYLGIAADGNLWSEFLLTLDPDEFDGGSCSSRLLTGNFHAYTELENLLAEMFNREAALVFNSGYHANMGILQALSGKKDLILSDKLNHASIIDGVRLCDARCIRYRHLDYEHIEQILEKSRSNFENVFIVTESIFSMDGDVADLNRLCLIKDKYNAFLYVDEAHAIGVEGDTGLGCAESQNCISKIDFIVGTFGKAIASQGAYLVADKVICDYLVNTMRTLIFTTGLPPISVKWTMFVLQHIAQMKHEREHLKHISELLRTGIFDAGFNTLGNSQIVPAIVGDNDAAVRLAEKLQNEGFFVLPIRPPTVPLGSSRIRFSLTASISFMQINDIISAL